MTENKTMDQLVLEMNTPPFTQEQLKKLYEDTSPEGRDAYLKAVNSFLDHAKKSAEEIKAALDREEQCDPVLILARQSENLNAVEKSLEGALRHVRAANANLRKAGKRSWWWICC